MPVTRSKPTPLAAAPPAGSSEVRVILGVDTHADVHVGYGRGSGFDSVVADTRRFGGEFFAGAKGRAGRRSSIRPRC